MPIGDYRHVVTFQTVVKSPDGDGGITENWIDLDPATWDVAILPATVRDLERDNHRDDRFNQPGAFVDRGEFRERPIGHVDHEQDHRDEHDERDDDVQHIGHGRPRSRPRLTASVHSPDPSPGRRSVSVLACHMDPSIVTTSPLA